MNEFVDFLIFNIPQPWNVVAVAGILTIMFYGIIPAIGLFVNWLEGFEFRILNRILPYRISSFIVNRLTLPGVIVHEYAHAIMASITGAKVTKIKVLEFFKGDTLGHVEFLTSNGKISSSIQETLASSAPVYIGGCLLMIMACDVMPSLQVWWHHLIFWYLFISIFNHMSMSQQDIKLYKSGLPVTMMITFLILVIVTLTKIPA